MLEGIVIQLPDGTTMTLADFNANVNSGVVDVSDAGFILPDGSILPTNGEPLFGAYPDEMIALMQPYIVQDGVRDGDTPDPYAEEEVEIVGGEIPPQPRRINWVNIAVLGIVIYLIVNNKK